MLIAELGYAVPILGSTLEMEFLTDQAGQYALRKHANSNMLKTLQPKKENFHLKNSDIFHISAQNIDCGYMLEPPQRVPTIYVSMFFSKIRKIMYTPVNPSFTI